MEVPIKFLKGDFEVTCLLFYMILIVHLFRLLSTYSCVLPTYAMEKTSRALKQAPILRRTESREQEKISLLLSPPPGTKQGHDTYNTTPAQALSRAFSQ
jgi:hypothetical protein